MPSKEAEDAAWRELNDQIQRGGTGGLRAVRVTVTETQEGERHVDVEGGVSRVETGQLPPKKT